MLELLQRAELSLAKLTSGTEIKQWLVHHDTVHSVQLSSVSGISDQRLNGTATAACSKPTHTAVYQFLSKWHITSRTQHPHHLQDYQSPERKNSPTFPDEIAGNMSNKCTFIDPNSLRTSRMQNELRYEWSSGKLHDDLKTCPHSCDCISTTVWLPAFCWAATIKFPRTTQIPWPFPDFGPFSRLFTNLSGIPWHFQVFRNSKKVATLHLMAEGANTSGQRCPFPQIKCRFRHPFNVIVNRKLIQHRIYTEQKFLLIFCIGVLVRALTVSNHSCSLSPKSGQDRVWEKLRVRLRVSSGLQLTGSIAWTSPFRPNHFYGLSKAVFQKAVWTL